MHYQIAHRRKPLVFAIFVASAAPAAAEADALKTLQQQVRQAGFEPVYPLAEAIMPGALYSVTKGVGGIDVPDTLCDDAFISANPPPTQVVLATTKVSNSTDLKTSLGLLSALFKNVGNASASLDSSGATKGSIVFGTPKVNKLPSMVLPNGTKRQVSHACADALKAFFDPATGKPTRDVFLIVRTLSVSNITYDVTVSRGHNASLAAALKQLFTLNFSYHPTSETEAQLIFKGSDTNRQVIGVNRVKIIQYKPDTMIGAARTVSVTLNGEELHPGDAPVDLPVKP